MREGRAIPDLVPYGIDTEQAQLRAHVCFLVQKVYFFPVKPLRELLASRRWEERPAFQDGVETARGFLVPWRNIPEVIVRHIPRDILDRVAVSHLDDESKKGQAAVEVVKAMLRRGLFPVPLWGSEEETRDGQLSGVDIVVSGTLSMRIQVKCDFKGGDADLGGSGNLYIQTRESNPFGKH